MRTFRVELGENAHPVYVGSGLLGRLGELARGTGLVSRRAAVITDSNVAALYGAPARDALAAEGFETVLIEVAAGEPNKSLATLESVYDALVSAELDRNDAVFALGGGVVGDLAGFAAATYLRGVPLVQVPTSTVAQADSALGGKTGVNHRLAKNLIGSFYQPRLIVADVATLKTLPEREFREGLAEVIKYAAIRDAQMLDALERDLPAILGRDLNHLEQIMERSLSHKAFVVASDEREGGLRKILNFGHTVGHALEAGLGYGHYLHGEAVAIGMMAAAKLSCLHAGLSLAEAERLKRVIETAGLPVTLPDRWRGKEFVRALKLDKKRAGEGVEFVLLDRLGHAMTRRLKFDEILSGLA